jgi:hypothetical protein
MKKINLNDAIFKIVTSEILISFVVFVVASCFVVNLTVDKVKDAYSDEFIRDVIVESHGMLFDILIIGTLIFALHKLVENRKERKRNIERWQEEIDNFRYWKSEEAAHRIVGNIKRLNKNGKTNIDISGCYLENAILSVPLHFVIDMKKKSPISIWVANLQNAVLFDTNLKNTVLIKVNLQQANLCSAKLQNANLLGANLQKADLWKANLWKADLGGVNLHGADFEEANLEKTVLDSADLRSANNLTLEQLSKVKTLYQAQLDPELEKEIKEKYPHLLEKPKEED